MSYWENYNSRINLYGTSQRERLINRHKDDLNRKLPDSGSYKSVKLNGVSTSMVINSSTRSYYKEFTSLPNQKILAGDYVEWANNTWLIYEADCDDEVYIDGKMYQCNYTQRWQNELGEIIERPSYITRESSNGEDENKELTVGSNEFFVYMPFDDETVKLRNGKRIYIDNYFAKPYPYELTLPDNVSIKFGEKGVVCYLFKQTQTINATDKVLTLPSGEKVWIADYFEPSTPTPPDETTDLLYISSISSAKQTIAYGSKRKFTAVFKDKDGNVVTTLSPKWTMTSDFADKLSAVYGTNDITITIANDKTLVDKKFILKLEAQDDSAVYSEMTVTIIPLF